MSNWEEITLDKLGHWSYAKVYFRPLNDSRLFGNKYPFVENSDLAKARLYLLRTKKKFSSFGLLKSRLHEAGTLCISAAGTVGYAAILKQPSCISKNVIFFNSFPDKSDVRFVKYCFDILREKIITSSQTTTRGWISSKVFDEVKFPVPTLEIQKKIGDILATYDELIENHQRQIEILEQLRVDFYKEWFINLRFPNYKKTLIKGNLPEGWKKANLKDFVSIVTGKRNANFANLNGRYSFFTCGCEALSCCSYSFNTEAIILSGNGNFYLRIFRGKFDAYQRVYVIEPNRGLLYLSYCAIDNNLKKLFKNSKGSTIKFLTLDMLQDIKVFLPEQKIMELFNEICGDIQTKIEKLDAKMRKN